MTTNPLVSGPLDVSTPFTGTFLLEDIEALSAAVESGNWVAGGLASFAGVMDAAAFASDPLGALFAMGIGWLLEHLEPLRGWLNDLTGDAGQVAGFAATWGNIRDSLVVTAEQLARRVDLDLDGMAGVSIEAYRALQADVGRALKGAAGLAGAMATALDIASMIVQAVHDIVRDAIAEVVGAIASYALELVLTAGLAAPLVIEQVATKVASLVGRVAKFIDNLLRSAENLARHADEITDVLRRFDGTMSALFRDTTSISPRPVPRPKPRPAVPPVRPPDRAGSPPVSPKPDPPDGAAKPKGEDAGRPDGPDGDGKPRLGVSDDDSIYYIDKSLWDMNRPYAHSRPRLSLRTILAVWQKAKGADGFVRGPDGKIIRWEPGQSRQGIWDMGHVREEQYAIVHDHYMRGGMTTKEFVAWYNDPIHYEVQLPGLNRAGIGDRRIVDVSGT